MQSFLSRFKAKKALAIPAGLIMLTSFLAAPTPTASAAEVVPTPSGNGYWLVATDGGVFTFGDAGFYGSLGDVKLNKAITGMVPTPTGNGYWLVASDGGIFAFGDAEFFGSTGGIALNKPIVGMANSGEESGFSAAGAKGNPGPTGPAGAPGLNGRDATYVGPDWSIIDRNVLGNGDSYLRAGPGCIAAVCPGSLGQGSLGIRIAGDGDKVSFGSTTAYDGVLVKDLTKVSFSVFTSTENSRDGAAPANLPNLTFEIDPNMLQSSNYSSLVFVPGPLTNTQSDSSTNGWTVIDATTSGIWALTGNQHTDCRITPPPGSPPDNCTFAEMQDYLNDADSNDAVITFSTAFSKGSKDISFSGAVDRLRINNDLYDFEPFGVVKTAIPAS